LSHVFRWSLFVKSEIDEHGKADPGKQKYGNQYGMEAPPFGFRVSGLNWILNLSEKKVCKVAVAAVAVALKQNFLGPIAVDRLGVVFHTVFSIVGLPGQALGRWES
jgi:hypothetical protein